MRKVAGNFLERFGRDARGNVAIVLALAALPLFGAAGAAVDYAGRSQAEAKLQAAIDAGTLAGAASTEANQGKVRQAVRRFAKANGSDKYLNNDDKVKVKFLDDGSIQVTASGDYPTSLMRIVGFNSLPLKAFAESKRAEAGAEISLVLDVTGSMQGAKIDALKVAAADFVTETTKPNANKPDAVRLSIVPYNQYVNVGMANRNASWIDVPADYTETKSETKDWPTYSNPHNCRTESTSWWNDGVQQFGTREVCDYDVDNVNETRTWTEEHKWYGCAGSREYPWNVRDGRPNLDIPGLLNTWCPNEITPLTSDATQLKGNIGALNASGNTYIPAGLIWGWRTLSSDVPYTEGLSYADADAKGVTKHLVLMTDGENVTSKSAGSGYHDGWDPAAGDSTTAELCTNIKDAGIIIHAIAFDVTDADTKSMLQACASGTNYYDAGDSTALASAFDAIAGKINQIALSK